MPYSYSDGNEEDNEVASCTNSESTYDCHENMQCNNQAVANVMTKLMNIDFGRLRKQRGKNSSTFCQRVKKILCVIRTDLN